MNTDDVRERLRTVEDPDLGADIVSLGLINSIDVTDDEVSIDLALGAPYSPTETSIANEVREALGDIDREIDLSASVDRGVPEAEDPLPKVKNVIAVSVVSSRLGPSTSSASVTVSPISNSSAGVVSGTSPSRRPICSSNITLEFSTTRISSTENVGTSAIIARRIPLAKAGVIPRTRNRASRSVRSTNSTSYSPVMC